MVGVVTVVCADDKKVVLFRTMTKKVVTFLDEKGGHHQLLHQVTPALLMPLGF